MEIREDLFYTENHHWLKVFEDNVVYLGLTEYIQEKYGIIGFVELPKIGYEFEKGEVCGYIGTKDGLKPIISPVSGIIERINEDLDNEPGLINSSPYENGWLLRYKVDDPSEFDFFYKSDDYCLMIKE